MSDSLKILQHAGIKQTGEFITPRGKLFAPVVQLQGGHRIHELHTYFLAKLKPCVEQDFSDGSYQAVFIEPQEMIGEVDLESEEDPFVSQLWDEGAMSVLGYNKEAYLPDRDPKTNEFYRGGCIHTHSGFTVALSLKSGNRATEFVLDDQQLGEELLLHGDQIRTILSAGADPLFDERLDLKTRSIRLTQSLYWAYDAFPQHRLAIEELQNDLRDKLAMIQRQPHYGRYSVFQGDVFHAAAPAVSDPGSLFVEHFRIRKPR